MQSAKISGTPILGIDVWEHSYYLKYGPGRATFLANWFKLVNWKQVGGGEDWAGPG